jgi:protein TonB
MENKMSFFTRDSLDEIVFSGRNKEYGAYAMRKAYSRFVNRALVVASIILLISALIPFIYWRQTANASEEKTISTEMFAPPVNKEKVEEKKPEVEQQKIEEQARFVAPKVVLDTTATTDINQDDLNQKQQNTAVDVNAENVDEGDASDQVIEQVVETQTFTVVEEMPTFPGGDESRIKFLQDNITYPQMAKESNIQGTVYVTFTTDEKGRVTDVQLQRGIGGGCDEEAIRVVKMMPPWNPGKQNGKPVRVRFTMNIKFTLN